MYVVIGVFVVLAVITLVVMRRDKAFDAEFKYENLSPVQKKRADAIVANIPTGDSDKNVRYADRIREASSIGLGMSMFLVSQRVSKNRIMSLPELMKEFSTSDLLPPGVAVLLPDKAVSYGLLKTGSGLYYLNYSPRPLKIEVLAASFNGLHDGAVFVLRLPDTSAANLKPQADSPKVFSAGAWATLFEAPENPNHYIPPPFSPAETYRALNWQTRPLQQSEISPQRMAQLSEYLQKLN